MKWLGSLLLFASTVNSEEMLLESQVSAQAMTSMMTEEFAYTSDKATLQKLQCPMGKVGCPLCYEIVDRWNANSAVPGHADNFCNDVVNGNWKGHYQTLTGKSFNYMKEK